MCVFSLNDKCRPNQRIILVHMFWWVFISMFSASRNSLAVFMLLRMQLHVGAWGFMVFSARPPAHSCTDIWGSGKETSAESLERGTIHLPFLSALKPWDVLVVILPTVIVTTVSPYSRLCFKNELTVLKATQLLRNSHAGLSHFQQDDDRDGAPAG